MGEQYGPTAIVVEKGPNRGLDFDLFTQIYMIIKKLTFYIPFKKTIQKFSN